MESQDQKVVAPRKYRKSLPNPADQEFARLYRQGDKSKGIRPNNATAAYREVYGRAKNPAVDREMAKRKLTLVYPTLEAQRKKIERYSDKAIDRLGKLVDNARSEMVQYSASSYLADQAHGKATQRLDVRSEAVVFHMDLTKGDNQGTNDVAQDTLSDVVDAPHNKKTPQQSE